MTREFVLAACVAMASGAAFAANPFEAFKGKVKEGLYEYKMQMEAPGMPPGMGAHTMQNCITAKDIEAGGMSREKGKMPENCQVKNFNMSGSTATYTMECTGDQPMKADTRITFSGDGFKQETKMAMNQGGQVMNMTQRMEGKYLGPCTK